MRWWALPAWNGDFRLTAGDDATTSKLLVMAPTPHEVQLLNGFLSKARKKKWTSELLTADDTNDTRTIVLDAPITKTGPLLVRSIKPADRTLTAVSFKDGRLEVAETGAIETLVARAVEDPEAKAVSVSRPTPCCPRCEVGSIAPARDVLLSFLSPQEHADWADHRAIIVRGGTSGRRYLLAHRHSQTAARLGKICYDLDDHFVLHFHDQSVPPEEEVLAAKLILEHREPWLRNEATCLLQTKDGHWHDLGFKRYKNPFGDVTDGRIDAAITVTFGIVARSSRGPRFDDGLRADDDATIVVLDVCSSGMRQEDPQRLRRARPHLPEGFADPAARRAPAGVAARLRKQGRGRVSRLGSPAAQGAGRVSVEGSAEDDRGTLLARLCGARSAADFLRARVAALEAALRDMCATAESHAAGKSDRAQVRHVVDQCRALLAAVKEGP